MTAFRRLAAALAACSAFTTSVALPTEAATSDGTACTIDEHDTYDNYGITIPVAWTADQCIKNRWTLEPYTTGHEDDWVCEAYGNWTILIFTANKKGALGINQALGYDYPGLTFNCPVLSKTAGTSSALSVRDSFAPACTVDGNDQWDVYLVVIPTPYDEAQCQDVEDRIQPYIENVATAWACQPYQDGTFIMFNVDKEQEASINEVLAEVYPDFDLTCTNSRTAKADLAAPLVSRAPSGAECRFRDYGEDFDDYLIFVPIDPSEDTCNQLLLALSSTGDPSLIPFSCGAYDEYENSTRITFRLNKGLSGTVTEALVSVYPSSYDYTCYHEDFPVSNSGRIADPKSETVDAFKVSSEVSVVSRDPSDGDCYFYTNDTFESYHVHVPVDPSNNSCYYLFLAVSPYSEGVAINFDCGPASEDVHTTHVYFQTNIGSSSGVTEALGMVFPDPYDLQCHPRNDLEADARQIVDDSEVGLDVVLAPRDPSNADCYFYNNDTFESYHVLVPVDYTFDACYNVYTYISGYNQGIDIGFSCGHANGYNHTTGIYFQTKIGSTSGVSDVLAGTYPSYEWECYPMNAAKTKTRRIARGTSETSSLDVTPPAKELVEGSCDFTFTGDGYGNYSIKAPEAWSQASCDQLYNAVHPYTDGTDIAYICSAETAFSTSIRFRAIFTSMGAVTDALTSVYSNPSYNWHCAATAPLAVAGSKSRHVDHPTSGIVSLDASLAARDAGEASCDFVFADGGLRFSIYVPVAWSKPPCDQLYNAVLPYGEGLDMDYSCEPSAEFDFETAIQFLANFTSMFEVGDALASVYPDPTYNWHCSILNFPPDHSRIARAQPKTLDTLPPATCTIHEWPQYDKYTVNISTPYSSAKCHEAYSLLSPYFDGPTVEGFCYPYGDDYTMIEFAAGKAVANEVNYALQQVYPDVEFTCANSIPGLVEKNEVSPMAAQRYPNPIPLHTQACVTENHGLYNSYYMHIGEPYDLGKCDLFGTILNNHEYAMNEYMCFDDHWGNTEVSFDDTINRNNFINFWAKYVWPEVNGFNCPGT